VPLDWAKTQINLGRALTVVGKRTQDQETLVQARDALAAARAVFRDAGYTRYDGYLQGLLHELDSTTAKLGAEKP
jgi:hypothetical protein